MLQLCLWTFCTTSHPPPFLNLPPLLYLYHSSNFLQFFYAFRIFFINTTNFDTFPNTIINFFLFLNCIFIHWRWFLCIMGTTFKVNNSFAVNSPFNSAHKKSDFSLTATLIYFFFFLFFMCVFNFTRFVFIYFCTFSFSFLHL